MANRPDPWRSEALERVGAELAARDEAGASRRRRRRRMTVGSVVSVAAVLFLLTSVNRDPGPPQALAAVRAASATALAQSSFGFATRLTVEGDRTRVVSHRGRVDLGRHHYQDFSIFDSGDRVDRVAVDQTVCAKANRETRWACLSVPGPKSALERLDSVALSSPVALLRTLRSLDARVARIEPIRLEGELIDGYRFSTTLAALRSTSTVTPDARVEVRIWIDESQRPRVETHEVATAGGRIRASTRFQYGTIPEIKLPSPGLRTRLGDLPGVTVPDPITSAIVAALEVR